MHSPAHNSSSLAVHDVDTCEVVVSERLTSTEATRGVQHYQLLQGVKRRTLLAFYEEYEASFKVRYRIQGDRYLDEIDSRIAESRYEVADLEGGPNWEVFVPVGQFRHTGPNILGRGTQNSIRRSNGLR